MFLCLYPAAALTVNDRDENLHVFVVVVVAAAADDDVKGRKERCKTERNKARKE